MADVSHSFDHTPIGHPNNFLAHRILVISFAALAFIILAGTRPFEGSLLSETGTSGRGSAFEALLYLATSVGCLGACLHLAASRLINLWTVSVMVLLGYCAFSLTWSHTASIGIVRFGQLALVTLAVAGTVLTLGTQQVFQITYRILLVILLVNFLSVALIPSAVHQIGESGTYPANVTSWKGVHIHKNYAGPVAALTASMAFILGMSERRIHLLVALAAFAFLWNTNSSASLLALSAGVTFMVGSKVLCWLLGRDVARFVLLFLLVVILVAVPFLSKSFAELLNDPYALTGRVELWHALIQYIKTYPWTGSGYGSFWRVGDNSPILHLTDGWATETGQGHNGYLDVAATIGIPGLVIVVCLLIVAPCVALFRKLQGGILEFEVILAFFVFALVHNAAETSLLSPNHPVYFALLLAVFGVSALPARTQKVDQSHV